jgi:ATP-dependent Clp protease ATP-binding subunit ClpC
MFERFTDRARQVVILAQEEARMLDHDCIGTEHILLGIVHEGGGVAANALESLGISGQVVRYRVEEIIGRGQQAPSGHIPFTPRAKKVLELSLREALERGDNYIGTEHILLGLIREGDGVAAHVLIKLGADLERVRRQVTRVPRRRASEGWKAIKSAEPEPPTSAVLDQFGRNLTHAAWEGKLNPVIGREKEIERVIQILSRLTKNNPVLVGAHGVGKTALVEGLTQEIIRGQVLRSMKDKLVYRIDVEILVERSGSQDEVKAHLQAVVGEVRARGDVILFLDGLRVLPVGAWVILKPMLIRGELQIIGAMTPDEYRDLLDTNPALLGTFVPIRVAEPTVEQTIEILWGLRDRYEAHHRVSITDDALVAAAELADRRLPGRPLPAKAIDLMDEAASLLRILADGPPPQLREYDEKIAQARKDRDSAIDEQNFEKAAAVRDTEKQLLAKKEAVEREWRTGNMDVVAEVNEGRVAETVAIMLGLSSDGAADVGQSPAARGPRFAPAAMTDDDREIWAIS